MAIASAWSWRFLVIAGAVAVLVALVVCLRLLVVPVLLATLLAALLIPFRDFLVAHRVPRWAAIVIAEVGLILAVSALLYLVVTQVVSGLSGVEERLGRATQAVTEFLAGAPFHLSADDVAESLERVIAFIQENSSALISGVTSAGSSIAHFAAGLLLTLFTSLVLLIDGRGIWAWIVRLFPRAARDSADGAGRAGWRTLTAYAKAQILVATIDAVGIGIGAAILGVPFALPIAVLVFLGSFIPIIGAVVTGAIATLIALVYNGWVVALIMLGIVLLVQQIESHVLQPLIMGKAVRVHPLAVVLGVFGGSIAGGVFGALFAVPLIAVSNTVVRHVAQGREFAAGHPAASGA
ncbi:AI-2E family transporter [Microbacterium sp. ZW T5_45]|uniref:AI-2E family transporter n=1 Tax=Microbacterium sp. ZW T5_45 TaxID=3378080 RepID=UPI003854086D